MERGIDLDAHAPIEARQQQRSCHSRPTCARTQVEERPAFACIIEAKVLKPRENLASSLEAELGEARRAVLRARGDCGVVDVPVINVCVADCGRRGTNRGKSKIMQSRRDATSFVGGGHRLLHAVGHVGPLHERPETSQGLRLVAWGLRASNGCGESDGLSDVIFRLFFNIRERGTTACRVEALKAEPPQGCRCAQG
jgi:hypothetical protein